MLRDRLVARMREMGSAPDYQRLAEDVLGIRGASATLARALVAQALVLEDRRTVWRSDGERICADAPSSPGVYVLRDRDGHALYVGKAVNLRRRLRAHFAERRWRALKPAMARVTDAEWTEVGSELEALLREADLIHTLQPIVNVQTGPPDASARAIPAALVRDVIVIVPSVEQDSAELVGARVDGPWLIQRTRRNGADLPIHAKRFVKFFRTRSAELKGPLLSPIVFSWLARRGAESTRVDPHANTSTRSLCERLIALVRDERLFLERLEQR
jgi:predicted GIY-YIG superfamily endonuclease